jgi:putative transposase
MSIIFEISRSSYYDWLNRAPSKRELSNNELDEKIKYIFEKNKSRYGAPRITRKLKQQEKTCSYNRVARKMKR